MKNLFLVDGASGTGKSDLVKLILERSTEQFAYVTKATTRSRRDYEDSSKFLLDLEFISEEEFEARHLEYRYKYGDKWYGFSRKDLNAKLLTCDNVFVIVRNLEVIRRIMRDYSFIDVIPILIHTEQGQLKTRLKKEGLNDADIKFRLLRSHDVLNDYIQHPDVYRETVLNIFSEDVFQEVIGKIVAKYNQSASIDPHLVSVMMSFTKGSKLLADAYRAIQEAVRTMGMTCTRVDEETPGSPQIAEEFRRIAEKSRLLIVDLTENRPNVYYELGYAQARGRTCILTAHKETDASFYARERRILFYETPFELRDELVTALDGIVKKVGI